MLTRRLSELLPGYPGVRILVALSGGLDSTVLLAALCECVPRAARLRAVHVDHGIHPQSAHWAQACRRIARSVQVPVRVVTTRVTAARGQSLEEAARILRYAALADELQAGEVLLTAHHADDQVETVLLQLFRGAGVAGLAAMPAMARFASGWHARPLLAHDRAQLEAWARARQLVWIEDDSNQDERLDRNYLRHQVLPLIRQRWQGAGGTIARSARLAAEAQLLLNSIARADTERAANGADLSVAVLRTLSAARRRNALRFWLDRAGARAPDSRRLQQLAGPLIDARADANPHVAWGDVQVQRHAGRLALQTLRSAPTSHPGVQWDWKQQNSLKIPWAAACLEIKRDAHGPIDLDLLPDALLVRPRSGGERIRPARGAARRTLKGLLQQARVPMDERAALPLIYADESLVAAGSLWVDASFRAKPGAARRARLVLLAVRR